MFFFCSGFALILGKKYRFDNWYKRRVQRIIPTVIVVSLLAVILFNQEISIIDLFLCKKYWFVNCILVYYALFYPIFVYAINWNYIFWVVFIGIVGIWFGFYDFTGRGIFYGEDSFRRYYFFLFMLQGAIIGFNRDQYKFKKWHLPALILSVILWYAVVFITKDTNWQIISVLPLLCVSQFAYNVSCSKALEKLYNRKYCGKILYSISALCLEIYVIQKFIISDKLNDIFPINIPIVMILIVLSAYVLRVLSNFARQTLEKGEYQWYEMIKI